jgi:hypothetical protein
MRGSINDIPIARKFETLRPKYAFTGMHSFEDYFMVWEEFGVSPISTPFYHYFEYWSINIIKLEYLSLN